MTVRSGAAGSGTVAAVTVLDVADLVVIAGRVLGIGTDAALAQMDVTAARAALAEAGLADAGLAECALSEVAPAPATLAGALWRVAPLRDRAGAAAAGVGLVHALLRHRPFPWHSEQVAITAGLQFLSLNGWRADLNPPAPAVVVVEALASGQLSPDAAAAWLSPRLSQARRAMPLARTLAALARASVNPARQLPRLAHIGPNLTRRARRSHPVTRVPIRRAVASALLALAIGGISLLAAACSRAPVAPAGAVHSSVVHAARSPRSVSARRSVSASPIAHSGTS